MKLFAAIVLSAICVSVSAQDQIDHRVHFACVRIATVKLQKCQTTRGYGETLHLVAEDTRYTSGADFARHAQVGDKWWPVGDSKIDLTLAAVDLRQEGAVYRLSGNSEIHTTAVSVVADDIVYHSDTGEFEPRGNVRVKTILQ